MNIKSVNLSLKTPITVDGETVSTGIFKEPAKGPVAVKRLNLVGDQQADLKYHGGVCKAVYAYCYENYAHWATELSRTDFNYGQFGENLTLEGLVEEEVYIGDLLCVGTATFEVTQPRVPCFKLGVRMGGLKKFPRQFLLSGRVGFYLRVLEEGVIESGDTIRHERVDPNSLSIADIHQPMHFKKADPATVKKAIAIEALAPGWCRGFEKQLQSAGIEYEPRVHPLEAECNVDL